MHYGSVVSLAAFIFLSGLPFGATQNTSSPAHQAGQSEIQIRVPTRLRIERTPGAVKVKVDRDSLESVKLTIDEGPLCLNYLPRLRVEQAFMPAAKAKKLVGFQPLR